MPNVEQLREIRGGHVPVVLNPDLGKIGHVLGTLDALRPHYIKRDVSNPKAQRAIDRKYREAQTKIDRWVASGHTEPT